MSKWCDTCHRNKSTGEYARCDNTCPVFGKDFEELAEIVVTTQITKPKMNSRELAKQIMYASEDIDYMDYVETYDEEVNALAREIDKVKELGLIYLLSALEMLSE